VPRILLVKTSSMGDVIHNLPIVNDIRARFATAEIHWVVEESFADVPRLHPGVDRVIPLALRRWRKTLYRPRTWAELSAFKAALRATAYDCILDTQGLVKSALIARMAQGPRCGLDWHSAWEPLGTLLYDRKFAVNPALHAVERYRLLAARALDLPPNLPLDYGIQAPALALPWLPDLPYAVLLHATSRPEKLWLEDHWITLGAQLAEDGLQTILPWGGLPEFERAQRLAESIPQASVPPRLNLREAAVMLARAKVVVGVDTGLVHLASALAVPTVALYCGSDPGENGLYAASPIRNLGGVGLIPGVAETMAAVREVAA
jgi:heptosyltransferase-1